MSVQHANRGVVKKDLQLYYNREWYKSFKGQSRTNLLYGGHFPNGYGMPQEAGSNALNQIIYLPRNPGLYSNYVLKNGALGGYSYNEYQLNIYNIEPSTTYCMSCWYAQDSSWNGDSASIFHARMYSSSGSNTATNGSESGVLTTKTKTIEGLTWQYRYMTLTSPSDATGLMEWYVGYSANNTAGYRYYTNLQVEKGSYPTLYNDIANNINTRNETVTNLLTSTYSSLPTNWSVDGSGQGSIGTYSYIESNTAIRIVDVSSNTRFYFLLLSGFTASTVYTFSVKYRKVSGTPTLRFQIQYYNSSNGFISSSFPTTSDIHVYDKDGWQVAWYTVNTPANTAKITWFIQDGDDYTTYSHSYDLKDPQIQTGKYPTAWISSSCTANTLDSGGGLMDLSSNKNNVNLTNASFDYYGYYFTTAGSNYLNTGITTLPSNTQLTIDLWTKPTSTTQTKTLISKWGSSSQSNFCFLLFLNWFASGNLYFLVGNSAGTGYSTHTVTHDLSTSSYINYTITYDNGAVKMYKNGVLSLSETSANTVLKSVTTAITIGADYDGGNPDTLTRSYDGIIPNVKLYSRPLTDVEVLQNFNATRKTYGI